MNREDHQYNTSNNLKIRSFLHKRYSTNPEGWMTWLFQQYQFKKNAKILKFGCGDGSLWAVNKEKIHDSWEITLTDKSSGILESATNKLKNVSKNIIIQQCDIEHPDRIDQKYDYVIANHMLYHVKNLGTALRTIETCLNDDGVFFASTIGLSNFKEMSDIIHGFTGNHNYSLMNETMIGNFSLDTGKGKLDGLFTRIEIRKHDDSLRITEAKPLAQYIISLNALINHIIIVPREEEERLTEYIQGILDRTGAIIIRKEAGTFICTQ